MINRRQFVTNVVGLALVGFTSMSTNAASTVPNSLQGSLNGPLRKSVFLPLVGQMFTVTGRSQSPIAMKLIKVSDSRVSFGTEQFSLVFAGPRDITFLEGIYTITHYVAGRTQLLLQPGGKDAYNRYYTASFNLLL